MCTSHHTPSLTCQLNVQANQLSGEFPADYCQSPLKNISFFLNELSFSPGGMHLSLSGNQFSGNLDLSMCYNLRFLDASVSDACACIWMPV